MAQVYLNVSFSDKLIECDTAPFMNQLQNDLMYYHGTAWWKRLELMISWLTLNLLLERWNQTDNNQPRRSS